VAEAGSARHSLSAAAQPPALYDRVSRALELLSQRAVCVPCSKQCSLDLLSFLLEIAFRVLHPRRETALTLEEMLVSTILLAALLVTSHIGQFQ